METKVTQELLDSKKYIDLNYILEIQNYQDSLKKWIDHFRGGDRVSQSVQKSGQSLAMKRQEELAFYFDKYLKTIKPVINNFTSMISALSPEEYGFFSSFLSQDQIEQIIPIYQPLRKFSILNKQKRFEGLSILSESEVNQMIRKATPIYKMNLQIPPQNDEIRFWASTIPIKKFTINGIVTKGKGLGRQGLGMPTANIKINPELNDTLSQYPNGIYITTLKIKGKPEIYVGASSLGTNPHYQNSRSNRILQTYIIHDFGEQSLYGQELVTQFHELIRLQFKFNDFSAFLNGMRNDIEVAKDWGIKHNLIKQ